MSKSHRVLMLCYYYPPIATSGTQRSLAFSKLLKNFNWKPTVLTVKRTRERWNRGVDESIPVDIQIERSGELPLLPACRFLHWGLNKLTSLFGVELKQNYVSKLFCFPDSQIAWSVLFKGFRLAKQVDLIYVSCSPFSVAVRGVLLKWLSSKPLVVDFRDAWSLNPYLKPSGIKRTLILFLEKLVLSNCDCLILNTEGAKELYVAEYPQFVDKIICIPNGYDGLVKLQEASANDKDFRIVHTGSFYGSRSPENILKALVEIDNPNIIFVHVGPKFEVLNSYKNKLRIDDRGYCTRPEALAVCGEASLLYLRQGHEKGVSDYVAVGAKTYDYLATGLPILAECPIGDNTRLVEEFASKSWIVSDEENAVSELVAAILEAYEQRSSSVSKVKKEFAEQFSRERHCRLLSEKFDSLMVE